MLELFRAPIKNGEKEKTKLYGKLYTSGENATRYASEKEERVKKKIMSRSNSNKRAYSFLAAPTGYTFTRHFSRHNWKVNSDVATPLVART